MKFRQVDFIWILEAMKVSNDESIRDVLEYISDRINRAESTEWGIVDINYDRAIVIREVLKNNVSCSVLDERNSEHIIGMKSGKCPKCRESVYAYLRENKTGRISRFCEMCGQKLKWSFDTEN